MLKVKLIIFLLLICSPCFASTSEKIRVTVQVSDNRQVIVPVSKAAKVSDLIALLTVRYNSLKDGLSDDAALELHIDSAMLDEDDDVIDV